MLLLGASATAVLAQASAPAAPDAATPPPPPGMHGHHMPPDPDKQLAHLTKKLSLTADQQAQIKPVLVARNQQMTALRSDTTLAGPDKMAKWKSINQDSRAKIDAVLTDQQKQEWAQLQQ